MTLADEDTNPIADNANRAIQGNVAMHVTLPGGQLWNQCKWRHVVAKFGTNASGAIWWPNLQLMQVVASGELTQVLMLYPGSVVPLAMFFGKVSNRTVASPKKN